MPKRTDLKKILVIGSGPIVIGQAAEFDYAGTQACLALKEEGYEVILCNSNPATIMTDTSVADKVYMEPLTLEYIAKIIRYERPDAIVPSIGGQTGLNLAMLLEKKGILHECQVELLGTKSESIERGAMFMLAFALEMDSAQCSTFLTRVLRDADFSPKHPVEVIVRYCLEHGYPYQTALQRDGAIESEWGEEERRTALYFWREFLNYFAQDREMEQSELAVLQEYRTVEAAKDFRGLRVLDTDSTDEELLNILGQLSMTAAAQGMQLGRKNRVQNVYSKTARETFQYLLTAPVGGVPLRERICEAAMSSQLDGAPDGSLFSRFRDEFGTFDIGRKEFYHFLYWGIPWENIGGNYDFRSIKQCDETGRAFAPILSRKRFSQLGDSPWSIGKRDMEYAFFLRFLVEHWEELPQLRWEDLRAPMAQALRRTWFGDNSIDISTDLFDYLLSLCMETIQPYFVFQLVIAMGYDNRSFWQS